jgi:hypothetical protein
VKKDWVEHELKNWSRWCNLGGTILPWGVSAAVLFDEDEAPTPIHEENAKRVQKVFDVAVFIERKVMQAEYLSPGRYSRHNGIAAAARKLEISAPAYETILSCIKCRVERVFT